jgi:hypothetical protein
VLGDFPFRLAFLALSTVCFSGMFNSRRVQRFGRQPSTTVVALALLFGQFLYQIVMSYSQPKKMDKGKRVQLYLAENVTK